MSELVRTNRINLSFAEKGKGTFRLYRCLLSNNRDWDEWKKMYASLADVHSLYPHFAVLGTRSELWILSGESRNIKEFETELMAATVGRVTRMRMQLSELYEARPADVLRLMMNYAYQRETCPGELVAEPAVYLEDKGQKTYEAVRYTKAVFLAARIEEQDESLYLVPAVRSLYKRKDAVVEGFCMTVSSGPKGVLVRKRAGEGDCDHVSVPGKQMRKYEYNALRFSEYDDDKVAFCYETAGLFNRVFDGCAFLQFSDIAAERTRLPFDEINLDFISNARSVLARMPITIENRLTTPDRGKLEREFTESLLRSCAACYTMTISPDVAGVVRFACDCGRILCIKAPDKQGGLLQYGDPEGGLSVRADKVLNLSSDGRLSGKRLKIFVITEKTPPLHISVSYSSDAGRRSQKCRLVDGYGLAPVIRGVEAGAEAAIALIDSSSTDSDDAYDEALLTHDRVQHITRDTIKRIGSPRSKEDSVTAKVVSELLIKADVVDRASRCFDAFGLCGWSFVACGNENAEILSFGLGGGLIFSSLTLGQFLRRYPAIRAVPSDIKGTLFMISPDDAIYRIEETPSFPIPDEVLKSRADAASSARAFLDFWYMRVSNDTAIYFTGAWRNDLRGSVARFPKVRMITCLAGDIPQSFGKELRCMICVSHLRTAAIPALPFPFKLLREKREFEEKVRT